MPHTCASARAKLTELTALRQEMADTLTRAESASSIAEAETLLEQARAKSEMLKDKMKELSRELGMGSFRFTVKDAINPYREAFVEGGVEDPALTAERKDIEIDLAKVLESDRAKYLASGLTEWANALPKDIREIVRNLTPDKRKIMEKEIKDGAIPIFMPGSAIQLKTMQDAITKLKPTWIKDGQVQAVDDPYIWDHISTLITNADPSLVADTPTRPYILLTKPTQAVPAETVNKTVQEQQELLQQMQRANPSIQSTSMAEYASLQAVFTHNVATEIKKQNKTAQKITPLDIGTYSRFINLPVSSGGNVPSGGFNPVDRQLVFLRFSAGGRDSRSGFRLSVRVEV